MEQKKPKKKIYRNQKEILDKIINLLKKDLPANSEAYIFGSLANAKFGKYIKRYNTHDGSDIDVIVFIKKENIPSHWKPLNVSKGWWDLYRGIKININNTLHKTDLLIVKENQRELAKKRIKEKKWKLIKI